MKIGYKAEISVTRGAKLTPQSAFVMVSPPAIETGPLFRVYGGEGQRHIHLVVKVKPVFKG